MATRAELAQINVISLSFAASRTSNPRLVSTFRKPITKGFLWLHAQPDGRVKLWRISPRRLVRELQSVIPQWRNGVFTILRDYKVGINTTNGWRQYVGLAPEGNPQVTAELLEAVLRKRYHAEQGEVYVPQPNDLGFTPLGTETLGDERAAIEGIDITVPGPVAVQAAETPAPGQSLALSGPPTMMTLAPAASLTGSVAAPPPPAVLPSPTGIEATRGPNAIYTATPQGGTGTMVFTPTSPPRLLGIAPGVYIVRAKPTGDPGIFVMTANVFFGQVTQLDFNNAVRGDDNEKCNFYCGAQGQPGIVVPATCTCASRPVPVAAPPAEEEYAVFDSKDPPSPPPEAANVLDRIGETGGATATIAAAVMSGIATVLWKVFK